MSVKTDTSLCNGCRICELACSFHHKGVFSPESSSIKISRDNLNGTVSISLDSSCDSCTGETRPLCIKYCVYGALKET